MILKIIIIAAIVSGVNILMRKSLENNFGSGMGKINNERWGMVDEKKYDR
jgi:hypothetical protein